MVRIRRARTDDVDFLVTCLAMAADWRPGQAVRTADEVLSVPALAHYIAGWLCPGDLGVVAEDDGPIGAAWWRYLSADDPGYGYIRDDVPELSIAVVPDRRRSGVGRMLLEQLLAEANQLGLAAVSLSVEADNPARLLYSALGFQEAAHPGGAVTMLWSRQRPASG